MQLDQHYWWYVDVHPTHWVVTQRAKPSLRGWPRSAGPFASKHQAQAWAKRNLRGANRA